MFQSFSNDKCPVELFNYASFWFFLCAACCQSHLRTKSRCWLLPKIAKRRPDCQMRRDMSTRDWQALVFNSRRGSSIIMKPPENTNFKNPFTHHMRLFLLFFKTGALPLRGLFKTFVEVCPALALGDGRSRVRIWALDNAIYRVKLPLFEFTHTRNFFADFVNIIYSS